MVNVQFADETEKVVVAYLSCPQDNAVYPNQGSVDLTDSRYAAFYESLPQVARETLQAPQSAGQ